MAQVLLVSSPAGADLRVHLADVLEEAGVGVLVHPGGGFSAALGLGDRARLQERVSRCSALVVLWSSDLRWPDRLPVPAALLREIALEKRVIIVTVDVDAARVLDVPLPIRHADLSRWDASPASPAFRRLLDEILDAEREDRIAPAAAAPEAAPRPRSRPAISEDLRGSLEAATAVLKDAVVGTARGAARLARKALGGLRPATRDLPPAEPPPPPTEPPPPPTGRAGAAEPAADAVLLAVAAPRRAGRGATFVARFAAYVESCRAATIEKLEELGEPGDRIVKDIAPSRNARWDLRAPVTVRLTSTSDAVEVTPDAASFEWNGRENVLSFLVRVKEDAPSTTVRLCFAVLLDGIPIAFIPIGVGIEQQAEQHPADTVEVRPPRSAFASYASKDASAVAGRLSSLSRWDRGLDIFQDCLDLKANEKFKPQLESEILERDVFLLFWSRNARASSWVRWEYETARDRRGLEVILPMPLEDPAIAPPPDEFVQDQWRDRFLFAGYAHARIAEEADRS